MLLEMNLEVEVFNREIRSDFTIIPSALTYYRVKSRSENICIASHHIADEFYRSCRVKFSPAFSNLTLASRSPSLNSCYARIFKGKHLK